LRLYYKLGVDFDFISDIIKLDVSQKNISLALPEFGTLIRRTRQPDFKGVRGDDACLDPAVFGSRGFPDLASGCSARNSQSPSCRNRSCFGPCPANAFTSGISRATLSMRAKAVPH